MFENSVLDELEVEANKRIVLDHLRKNRDSHIEELKQAREGFFILVKEELEEKLQDLKDREPVNFYLSLIYPAGHLDAYNTAISMLELHQEEVVTLNARQVRCLVDDQWDWQEEFKMSNSTYVSATHAL